MRAPDKQFRRDLLRLVLDAAQPRQAVDTDESLAALDEVDSQVSAIQFLNTEEAAAWLNLSPRTLEKLRLSSKGPQYRKFGRRVVYARTDLKRWADNQVRSSTRGTSI